ncbi:D-beta-hydroxybutyrate dehydrogenase, mitochondrial [Bagarius yarrelli]|uniref:D-beta-hydroxybutyrate dehydrogenase, mitochondrial n=1 Tax=Bagarius yarrelli TaxID=175774 RepID=A0A556VBE6_BAGYA|nr:D-beta-hydroxybutyrate dehydrogenase, mitochondrial [Bagarius yarrelli]
MASRWCSAPRCWSPFSISLTLFLAFAVPAALTWLARCAGFSDDVGATHCLALFYALFVLCVAVPRIPRGSVSVEGKAVFITGCDSGFGFALAKHLHKLGFTVFAGCLLKDQKGEGVMELENLHSDRMKVVQLDVSSDEQVCLWAVVNNAGVSSFGEVEFTTINTYKNLAEVNLWGSIRVTKAVLPLIRRAKGRVVNISSMYGRMGNVLRSSYCISKYGVEAFSDCLRYEMKAWGVKVSVVEPGNYIVATGILTRDIVTSTAERLWNEAPRDVQEDYGKPHFEQHMALMRSYCNTGQREITPVLDDITDAIVSKRPFTRYSPMEPYWWIRMQIMTHLPGAISDRLYF